MGLLGWARALTGGPKSKISKRIVKDEGVQCTSSLKLKFFLFTNPIVKSENKIHHFVHFKEHVFLHL